MHINRDLQAANLRNLLRTGAFRFVDEQTSWFPYTSGQIGPYYVQSITVESDGAAYAEAVTALVQLIREWSIEFDVIAGGETRDWDFSNPCAVMLRRPHLKIYKDGRTLGADIREKRVLHIVDLNNEGSSVRDYWLPYITRAGGTMVGVVAFVDRLEEGVQVMASLNLPLAAVVPLDDQAWQVALDGNYIAPTTHAALLERRRHPDAWALERLHGAPGELRRMHQDPQTRSKAEKIINYYKKLQPDIESLLTNQNHEN